MNAMTFLAWDKSDVNEANLGTSWFSVNEPSRVVSAHSLAIVLMPLTRLLMLPLVDSNACVIQKYLEV